MKETYTEKDGVLYNSKGDAVFTEEMKKDYTLLVPNMCSVHFTMLVGYFGSLGYNVDLLRETDTKSVAEFGLRFVHNDTCYPAILVIGELLRAVFSGKYDTHKIALVISQTGGGCRASNYMFLLKKALKKADLGYIPVLSFNFAGLDQQPGFKFGFKHYTEMIKAVVYGDLITHLKNQCEPYELKKGETQALVDRWTASLAEELTDRKKMTPEYMTQNYRKICDSFAAIGLSDIKKPKVGIVGEIYVKCAPLGNNNLERFLVENGAEVCAPGLMNFLLYCFYGNVARYHLYGEGWLKYKVTSYLINKFQKLEYIVQDVLRDYPQFRNFSTFDECHEMIEGIISEGVDMGEGWFLPAEVMELIHDGVNNIVLTQPFGCLPNHIVAKGIMKKVREIYPDANLVAVDYDASASKVNQENRLRLLLANAKDPNEIPVIPQ